MDFLTNHIDAGRPVYLRFSHDIPMNTEEQFVYDHHATVAFGYNTTQATREGETYTYSFVKLFDGWNSYSGTSSTGKRYVCREALTCSTLGNVIDHSIAVDMYVFLVSKVGDL